MKQHGRNKIWRLSALLVVIGLVAIACVWWDHLPSRFTNVLSEWKQLSLYNAGQIASDDIKIPTLQTLLKRNWCAEELMGLWQEEKTRHFVRYTDVKAKEDVYFIGCEWDEAEDVHESDLEYLGNGYFLWSVQDGQLTMIHQLNKGLAEIPKVHTLVLVKPTRLSYKDDHGKTLYFSKVDQ